MIASYLFAFLVILVTVWYLKFLKYKRLIDKIPGLPTIKFLPIWGNIHQIEREPTAFFKQTLDLADTYRKSGLNRMWVGPRPLVMLYDADFVEVLLKSQKQIDKAYIYNFLHDWLRTGLLTSTGNKWTSRRKLLTPAFHFRILNDFVLVFNEQSKTLVKKLESKVGGAEFNIFPCITLCALDIICACRLKSCGLTSITLTSTSDAQNLGRVVAPIHRECKFHCPTPFRPDNFGPGPCCQQPVFSYQIAEIGETAMGFSVNAQENSESEYVRDLYRVSDTVMNRIRSPWFHNRFLFDMFGEGKIQEKYLDVLHGFTEKVIKERKQTFQEYANLTMENLANKKRRLAFLDLLLCKSEDESYLSSEDIQEEVDTFMFEGHDTTAAGMNWALYLIGAHPDVQDKVAEEIKSVFRESDADVTMDQLKELKYLECVLKESQRLFPPVPMIGRKMIEDLTVGEYVIPKGTDTLINIAALHRDEKHFPEPNKFLPDRFLSENIIGRHPFCYVPFSAGPRNCIGQKFAMLEQKVTISSILRKFCVQSMQTRENLHPMGDLIQRPRDGIFVKLTART